MKYNFEQILSHVFPRYFKDVSRIQSSEANFASLLYYHLVTSGYDPSQLCTEMYTANLLKNGIRPDLVLFDDAIDGRFNYYKNCDKTLSNTPLKREYLRCVIEIKGGAQQHQSGLGKYFAADLLGDSMRSDSGRRAKVQNYALAIDIEKLGMWSSTFGTNGRDYVFLALDLKNPKGFWSDHVRDTFGAYCQKNKVHMIYFAQGDTHFWHYSPLGASRQLRVL